MLTRGIVAALTLVVMAGACTGEDPEAVKPPPALTAPELLEPAWTAELGPAAGRVPRDVFAFRTRGDLDLWRTDDTVVVVGDRGLRAFDAGTGEVAWTLDLPADLGTVCANAAEPGPTGIGGVLLGSRRDCDTAGAVDLTTGELLWSAPLRADPIDPSYADHPLHVGTRALTVEVPCEEDRRFDLATGRPLPRLTPPTDGCVHDLALGDGVVAVSHQQADTLTLHDEDSGRPEWTTALPGAGAVTGVVSTDPLVLAVDQLGHEFYRHFDDEGRPGAYLGRQYDDAPQLVGVLDGVLVVSYDVSTTPGASFRGFDVDTGEQLWTREADELVVAGEQDGRILTLQRPLAETDHGDRVWVGRADPRDPGDQVALGSIAHDPEARFGWTDGLLLRRVGGTLEAYALPDADADADAPPMPELPLVGAEPDWADDDVRPEQVADICLAVPTATIRSLGFRSAELPVPADCTWHDVLDERGVDRLLRVTAFAFAPAASATGVESARAWLDDARDDGPGDVNHVGPFEPLPGLGDEAIAAGSSRGGEVAGRLLVRAGNVVLVLHSQVRTYAGRTAPTPDELRAGQVTVVEGLLDTLP